MSSPSPTRRAASARPRPRSISARRWRRSGHRVLVIDLDPQGNASTGLGIPAADRDFTSYDLLFERATGGRPDAARPMVPNLRIIPATPDLSSADVDMVSDPRASTRCRTRWPRPAARLRRAGLHPDRLPAVAEPADHQRAGRREFRAGAAAVRVLRARGAVAADPHRPDRARRIPIRSFGYKVLC